MMTREQILVYLPGFRCLRVCRHLFLLATTTKCGQIMGVLASLICFTICWTVESLRSPF